MISLTAGTCVWIAAGSTDMRSGFNGLAAKVQTALAEDPFSVHVFVFRGKRGDLIKVLWWTGDGLCLLAKCLERGRFGHFYLNLNSPRSSAVPGASEASDAGSQPSVFPQRRAAGPAPSQEKYWY